MKSRALVESMILRASLGGDCSAILLIRAFSVKGLDFAITADVSTLPRAS